MKFKFLLTALFIIFSTQELAAQTDEEIKDAMILFEEALYVPDLNQAEEFLKIISVTASSSEKSLVCLIDAVQWYEHQLQLMQKIVSWLDACGLSVTRSGFIIGFGTILAIKASYQMRVRPFWQGVQIACIISTLASFVSLGYHWHRYSSDGLQQIYTMIENSATQIRSQKIQLNVKTMKHIEAACKINPKLASIFLTILDPKVGAH